MTINGIRIFDAGSAVFEPDILWDTYVDREYRVAARSSFYHHLDPAGLVTIIVNGRVGKPMNVSKIIRQAIWRPGMSPRTIGSLNPEVFHPINPGASDPKARLADMDSLGVDEALLLPTLFAEYFPTVENPDVAYALARAYNDWILDFSKENPERLIPAAVLPVQDIGFAAAEARRVASNGFRAVALRPAFVVDRYLNHPYYFPLFDVLNELNLAACIHPSPGHTNPEWTSGGAFVEKVAANLRIGHSVAEVAAPTMDNAAALTAFLWVGHLEDYPELRVAFTHSGASWVPLALEKSETYLTLSASIQDVSLEPERVFENRPSLVNFDAWESSVGIMYDSFEKIAAWGSRYPAHDTTEPQEALDSLQSHGTPGNVIAKLMGGNAAKFYLGE